MARFDTQPVQIFVDVPGYDVDRAAKLFREKNARRALKAKELAKPATPSKPVATSTAHTSTDDTAVLKLESHDKARGATTQADPSFQMEL